MATRIKFTGDIEGNDDSDNAEHKRQEKEKKDQLNQDYVNEIYQNLPVCACIFLNNQLMLYLCYDKFLFCVL